MTGVSKIVVAIAAATALLGSPAVAAKKRMTLAATTTSGFDDYNTFRTGGSDLSGRNFTLILGYDTNLGNLSSFLFGSLTINGVTTGFVPTYGAADSFAGGTFNVYAKEINFTPTLRRDYTASFLITTFPAAGSLTTDIAPTNFVGSVEVYGTISDDSSASNATNFFVSADSGTFSISAIPEPASWAMLIAGFGLTGAAMRRTRRQVRVAA